MNIVVLIAFCLYLAVLLGIGLASHCFSRSEQFLGNRSLNFWVTALSAHASDMSSWLFMGFPAMVYLNGAFECWAAIGLTTCMFLNWKFVAPRLRVLTERYNCFTLSSYFEHRVGDTTGMIGLVSAIVSIFFFIFYIASGLVGLGRLFESVFQLSYHIGISVGIGIIIAYTALGGFLAVAWNDFFQALFLLVMIVLVPLSALAAIGGPAIVFEQASLQGISLSLFPAGKTALDIIYLALSWGLGYFGAPHILTKFMSIRDVRDMKKARWVGITWQILTLSAAAAIGLIGIAYFPFQAVNPELVFVTLVKQLFNPFMSTLILCAILAAALSTIDSQVIASAAIVTENIYGRWIRPKAAQSEQLLISRIGVVIIPLCSLFMARNNDSSIYELVNYAWTGLACSFGPLMLTTLHTEFVTPWGALSGILVGSVIAGVWPDLGSSVPAMMPGFFFSLMSILAVSWLTKK